LPLKPALSEKRSKSYQFSDYLFLKKSKNEKIDDKKTKKKK